MDWKKTQTILIITLLILNGVLWVLNKNNEESYTLTSAKESEVNMILEKNNIVVYDYYPSFEPMQRLKIIPSEINESVLLQLLLVASEGVSPTVTSTGRRYEKGDKVLEIISRGEEIGVVKYYNNGVLASGEVIDEAAALEQAKVFADTLSFRNVDWELTYIERVEEFTYNIQFNEYFKGYPMFSSYIKVSVNQNGIFYAEYKRMIPDELVENKRNIYSVDQVLYQLMNEIKEELPRELIRITSIDLGYDTKLNLYEEEQQQYVEPYYRIRLGDGREYFINAYTNELVK